MKILGIHHSKDLDGYMCGAITKLRYPKADLIGYDYGEDVTPLFKAAENYDLIIMSDVSIPMLDMLMLSELCPLVWVDHHVSAYNDFNKAVNHESETPGIYRAKTHIFTYVYDEKRAACEGLWSYLFPSDETPLLVQIAGKYDTWRQGMEKVEAEMNLFLDWDTTLAFQMGMQLPEHYDINEIIEKLKRPDHWAIMDEVVLQGMTVLQYQKQVDSRAAVYTREHAGLTALVKIGGSGSSTAFEAFWEPDIHDFCVTCNYDGRQWAYSLRTMKEGVDVSQIAKGFGGGGHKKAAGFRSWKFLFE